MVPASFIPVIADKVRSAVERLLPPRPAEPQKTATLKALPAPARAFVVGVIALAGLLIVIGMPRTLPDMRVFILLLLGSCIASGMKLKLPLGTSSSNLSISYTFDFATLLLLGTAPATFVAGFSAYAQTRFFAAKRNPTFRLLFNVSALIVTVQAAGATFT